MQKLGKVHSVSPSQNVLVKTDKAPKMGAEVVDENLQVIGKVFDIIGPVSAPYAIVKPTVRDPAKLAGKQLYLLLSKTKRSKK